MFKTKLKKRDNEPMNTHTDTHTPTFEQASSSMKVLFLP